MLNEDQLIITFMDNKTDNTRKSYGKELENWSLWLSDAPFASVTQEQAQAYFEHKTRKYAKASVIKTIRILRKFYELGVKNNVFAENPFKSVNLPAQDIGVVQDARILSMNDFGKLLKAVKENMRDYAIVLLLATSRFSTLEITNLTWKNLFDDSEGPRGAEVLTKGSTKASPKYRLIPISEEAMAAIYSYKTFCEREFHRAVVETDKVFLNSDGDPISETGIRKNIYALCKKAGLGKKVSPKDLAHLCVAMGRAKGASDKQLANQAGFSRPALVKKYKYLDLDVLKDPVCDLIKLPEH